MWLAASSNVCPGHTISFSFWLLFILALYYSLRKFSGMLKMTQICWCKLSEHSDEPSCQGGCVIKWLGCQTCYLVVLSSSTIPCYLLDLFLVVWSSIPWWYPVNSQLVWVLIVGIFKHLHSFLIYYLKYLFLSLNSAWRLAISTI